MKRSWWRTLQGQLLLALLLVSVLSAGGVAVVGTYVLETEMRLVLEALPADTRQVFLQTWTAMESHTDPALEFDLPLSLLLIGMLPMGLVLLVALAVQQKVVRPLKALSVAAQHLAGRDLPLHPGSEVAQLQQDFQRMTQTLQGLQHERQATAAAIAHELRTPLAVLQARLQAALDGVLPLDLAALRSLLDQTQLLSRLVSDLHTLAMAEVGELHLEKKPTDLIQQLPGWLELAQGEARNLQVRLSLQLNAPRAVVLLDPDRFQQVLHNLISNALRHAGPGGQVEVVAEVVSSSVQLEVRDSGPGIRPGEEEQLFSRFFRSDHSRNRHTGGSGLGLSVVQSIIGLHGGEIRARNLESGGACFTLTLPWHPES